jgi:plasmid maintenance system antidote protein VapI
MTKKEFQKLLDKYGPEELAESFVFPHGLSPAEKKRSDAEMLKILAERRAAMTPGEKLEMNLLRLRLQVDKYLATGKFDEEKTFGKILGQYIVTLGKARGVFAKEINVTPSELSQYINGHRKPPQNILVRLELHSNNNITAEHWYRLLQLESLHLLGANKALRTRQRRFVKTKAVRATN